MTTSDHRYRELDAIARGQHGLVTTSQLRALGFDRSAVHRLAGHGRLERVRRGVLRVAGAPRTRDQAWLAAVLATGDDAVLSHGTAAFAWGLKSFPDPHAIDVLSTASRSEQPGIRAHHTIDLPERHRTTLRGIPVTNPERTLIDACSLLSLGRLERSLDEALRRDVIDLERLRRAAETVPVSGRRRILPVRALLEARHPGYHPGDSQAELDVLRVIEEAGIRPLPVQQYRVEIEGHTYYLDFAWPETRVALEFDSVFAHGQVSDIHRDHTRIRRIKRAGWDPWIITSRIAIPELLDIARYATRSTDTAA